jgi:hypothetical protein
MKGYYLQACNDPQQWPFHLIADVVAQTKPDLVIHVGDYHYRETPCPWGHDGCAGSPFGDTWSVWRADFFAPADTLLKMAPWVFVRGNHEVCDRGGKGWSRTLEPFPFDAAAGCNGPAKPYLARLTKFALAVMDVSPATETAVNEVQMQVYREQYKSLATLASGPTWLLQHRPIWSVSGTIGGRLSGDNKTLAAAAAGLLSANIELILSDHHHIFQALNYDGDLPVQIVSGHGGDLLNLGPSSDPAGWVINGVKVKSGVNKHGTFGFAIFEQQNEGWQLTSYDRHGTTLTTCLFVGLQSGLKRQVWPDQCRRLRNLDYRRAIDALRNVGPELPG